MALHLIAVAWHGVPYFEIGTWDEANYVISAFDNQGFTAHGVSVTRNERFIGVSRTTNNIIFPPFRVYEWDGVNLTLRDGVSPGDLVSWCNEWSPDGKYIATCWSSRTFRVYSFDGANLVLAATCLLSEAPFGCSWSPDGRYLAIGHRNSVPPPADDLRYFSVYEFDGSSLVLVDSRSAVAVPPQEQGRGCAFSRDGKYIANVKQLNPNLQIFGFSEGSLTDIASTNHGVVKTNYGCDWNPKWRTQLAVIGDAAPGLWIYDFDGSNLTLIDSYVLPGTGVGRSCSWNPEGTSLAIGQGSGPIPRAFSIFNWDGANLSLAFQSAGEKNAVVAGVAFFKSYPSITPGAVGMPYNLLCEQKKNPTDVTDPQPEFSAIHDYEEEEEILE